MHPPEEPMKRPDIRLYQEFGIIKTCRSEHTHMQPLFAHNLLLLSVRAVRDRNGFLPTHSSSLLYRLSHHAARAWARLDELVESVGLDGMCANWLELPYPCGRARPQGASGPAVSGVHAAHKTAHP